MSITVTTPSDTEIRITRWFNAPRHLLYRALTEQTILNRWLELPGFSMTECTSDVRIGGKGGGMAITTVVEDVVHNHRIVGREKFDDAWYPGEAVVTQELTDSKGGTLLSVTIQYESREARDGVLKTPMTEGMGYTYNQLEALLGQLN
jgi:uncharacterized protein YndB with AHSA1/START domain